MNNIYLDFDRKIILNNFHGFNNDLYNPTITPSLLHTGEHACHSFITKGKIQFLGDCWHELKNQTVELPDVLIESEEL